MVVDNASGDDGDNDEDHDGGGSSDSALIFHADLYDCGDDPSCGAGATDGACGTGEFVQGLCSEEGCDSSVFGTASVIVPEVCVGGFIHVWGRKNRTSSVRGTGGKEGVRRNGGYRLVDARFFLRLHPTCVLFCTMSRQTPVGRGTNVAGADLCAPGPRQEGSRVCSLPNPAHCY